jgi:hypothetical protein
MSEKDKISVGLKCRIEKLEAECGQVNAGDCDLIAEKSHRVSRGKGS